VKTKSTFNGAWFSEISGKPDFEMESILINRIIKFSLQFRRLKIKQCLGKAIYVLLGAVAMSAWII